MANIPNKADNDVLSATELFKVAGIDTTGGSVNLTASETTIATVSLSANQLSAVAVLLAGIRFEHNDLHVNATGPCSATFKLKRGSTVLQTIVLDAPNTNAGSLGVWNSTSKLRFGGSMIYADTGATFSGALTYTVTCTLSNANAQFTAFCDSLIVLGV